MPVQPVPIERKRARGNPGKRALPKKAETVDVAPLNSNTPLTLGHAGADIWDQMHASAHWLGESDRPAMMMLADKFDRRADLLERMKSEPLVIVPDNGSRPATNPIVYMIDQVEKDIVNLLSLLGMTPTDRSRLGLAEVKKQSTLEKLRAQREAK